MVGAVMVGAAVLSLALVLYKQGADASDNSTAGETENGASAIRGPVEVGLESMEDSGTAGTVVFENIDGMGLQVELQVSGLPEKPGTAYYAQIHEGGCVGAGGEDGGHDTSGSVGYTPAVVRLDGLLARASEYAHGGEDGPADELPGNIDQPVTVMGSADGTAAVTSLLQGVTLDQALSGEPKYLDLHAADSEDAPILACADLRA